MNARIRPLAPPYSDDVDETLRRLMPPGMDPLALFRTVAHNPRVLKRLQRGGLLDPGSVSVRERELVILRTCFLCRAAYEWGVHAAAFGAVAGFTDDHFAAVAHVDDPIWTPHERLILRLCDALHASADIDDGLFEELSAAFDAPQIIELTMLAGLYHAVSFMVNVARVEPEPWARTWPSDAPTASPSR